jgi:hypothetical protein
MRVSERGRCSGPELPFCYPPYTSFYVDGLAISQDRNAAKFFGSQVGDGATSIAGTVMAVYNRLEPEGLAKGYRVNLTESDETSSFSHKKLAVEEWQRRCAERARAGVGRSAREL